MSSIIDSTAVFLIQLVMSAYITVLLLRFILQKCYASWNNPGVQLLVRLTEKPLRLTRWMPRYHGFDFGILLLAFFVQLLGVYLVALLQMHTNPLISGVLIMTIARVLGQCVMIYIYAVIAQAIASWIPALQQHPIMSLITLMVQPMIAPIRRKLPLCGGMDFSPMVLIVLLIIFNMLVVGTMQSIAIRWMLGS